jgi:hypothetical protein
MSDVLCFGLFFMFSHIEHITFGFPEIIRRNEPVIFRIGGQQLTRDLAPAQVQQYMMNGWPLLKQ